MNDFYWGGSAVITLSTGIAAPSAGETSPAHTGLTVVAVARYGDAVPLAGSVAAILRKVSESFPSSTATLILSACSGVTSNVTVRPKLPPGGVGFGSDASMARTRRFSTTVSPTERRVSGGSCLKVCVRIRKM